MNMILASAFCLLLAAAQAAPPCQFQLGGASYDVSPLMRGADNYKATTPMSGTDIYNYIVNICGNANGPSCDGSICQYNQQNDFVATLGRWTAGVEAWDLLDHSNPSAGLRLSFSNGDVCFGIGLPRVAHINLPCTPGVPTAALDIIDDRNGCLEPGYQFVLPTCQSCPGGCTATGMSRGTKFLWLLTICTILYIALGCLYTRKFKKSEESDGPLPWKESFPNLAFWQSLPGLVKDGATFSLTKAQGLLTCLKQCKKPSNADADGAAGGDEVSGLLAPEKDDNIDDI